MIIRRNGGIVGTIGGGRLEADAIRAAQTVFAIRKSAIQAFDLSGEDIAGMDMICGGGGEILLDYVAAGESNRRVYQEAAQAVEKREKAWLITALGDGSSELPGRQQCLVKQNGTLFGDFAADRSFLAKLTAGPAKISIHAEVLDGQRYLVEAVRPAATAYIFGAGHVSQKIAPLAEMVGFRAVVLDDRPEYANRDRFPAPTEVVLISSFEELPPLAIDGDSYLVIVTRGHLYDKTVLAQVLGAGAAYIGMIGSRRKRDKIYADLIAQGLSADALQAVHSPIGTDILAETPEELAVSIVGELIKVRAERENGPRT